MIKSIIKRDGRVVLYDEGKIASAILKAMEAAQEGDASQAAAVANAVEAALEEQGTNIEKYLQDYLVDLYREMVPADQVREIESCIKQERQEELR